MVCISNCIIASGFIMSSLILALSTDKNNLHENFIKILSPHQKEIYRKIINERKQIFIEGYFLGLLIALILIFYNKYNKIFDDKTLVCSVIMITGFVKYFYYTLKPKSDYMLLHLYSAEQNKRWLDIYKHMKNRCHLGFVIGIVGAGFLGNGLCK